MAQLGDRVVGRAGMALRTTVAGDETPPRSGQGFQGGLLKELSQGRILPGQREDDVETLPGDAEQDMDVFFEEIAATAMRRRVLSDFMVDYGAEDSDGDCQGRPCLREDLGTVTPRSESDFDGFEPFKHQAAELPDNRAAASETPQEFVPDQGKYVYWGWVPAPVQVCFVPWQAQQLPTGQGAHAAPAPPVTSEPPMAPALAAPADPSISSKFGDSLDPSMRQELERELALDPDPERLAAKLRIRAAQLIALARMEVEAVEHALNKNWNPKDSSAAPRAPPLPAAEARHPGPAPARPLRAERPQRPAAKTKCEGKPYIREPGLQVPNKEAQRTTIMMRNLPESFTRDRMLQLLDSEGFAACYDFFYMPADFQSWKTFGYAFLNLVSNKEAERAVIHLQGFNAWGTNVSEKEAMEKRCEVLWGQPLQGLDAHVERYRNSPVMSEEVPDACRPVFFCNGIRMPFPEATKRVRAPRKKGGSQTGQTGHLRQDAM